MTRRMDMAQYRAGRSRGAKDADAGIFRPQDFKTEPADFRQGYVDGWEDRYGDNRGR